MTYVLFIIAFFPFVAALLMLAAFVTVLYQEEKKLEQWREALYKEGEERRNRVLEHLRKENDNVR